MSNINHHHRINNGLDSEPNLEASQLRKKADPARLRCEGLEQRWMLSNIPGTEVEIISSRFNSDSDFFNQFTGGEATRLEENGFLGFEICKATGCPEGKVSLGGITDATIPEVKGLFGETVIPETPLGKFGAQVEAELRAKFGLEYGFKLDGGSARATYAGTFSSVVHDPGGGAPVTVETSSVIQDGSLFTSSPSIEAFADLVFQLSATDIKAQGCFVDCGAIELDGFEFDETLNLFSLNRDGDGEIKFLGQGLLDGSDEDDQVARTAQEARKDQVEGEIEKQLAERQRRAALSEGDLAKVQQAEQAVRDAESKIREAQSKETDAKNRARSGRGSKVGGFGVSFGEAEGDLLGVQLGFSVATSEIGSISITLPDISLTDLDPDPDGKLEQQTDSEDKRRRIAQLELDVTGIAAAVTKLPLGTQSIGDPLGLVSAELTTVSYKIVPSLNVNQEVVATPNTNVRYLFTNPITGQPVEVDVRHNGRFLDDVTSVTFSPGDRLELDPAEASQVLVTPEMSLDYEFRNDIGLDLNISGVFELLGLKLSGFGKDFELGPAFEDEHSFGDFDLGSVFDETFTIDGGVQKLDSFLIGGETTDLAVALVNGTDRVLAGGSVNYELVASNNGNATSSNVRVTTELDEHLTFRPQRSSVDCSAAFQVVTCELGDLSPSESLRLSITADVDEVVLSGLTVVSLSEISDQTVRDSDRANNHAVARTIVQRPANFVVRTRGDLAGTDERPFGQKCGTDICTMVDAIMAAGEKPGSDSIQPSGFLAGSEFKLEINQSGKVVSKSSNILNPRPLEIAIPESVTVFGMEVLCTTAESFELCSEAGPFDLSKLSPGGYVLRALAPEVANVSPVIVSGSQVDLDENGQGTLVVKAIDSDGDTVGFEITGGEDGSLFSINPKTGELRLDLQADFERPGDLDGDNAYRVEVSVVDDKGGRDVQQITFLVQNENERPAIESPSRHAVNENESAVVEIKASDPDADVLRFEIAGGRDKRRFSINENTGVLSFINPPNFEDPVDRNENNIYEVVVRATDPHKATHSRRFLVQVKDVTEDQNTTVPPHFEILDGLLQISGTEGIDQVQFRKSGTQIEIVTNFGNLSVDPASVTRFRIEPGDGEIQFADGVSPIQIDVTPQSGGDSVMTFGLSLLPVQVSGAASQIFVDNGVLTIIGTTGNDQIRLLRSGTENFRVKTNFGDERIPIRGIDRVLVQGLDGNDLVSLKLPSSVPAEVHGGPGNDRLFGSFGNDVLDGGEGNDKLNGRGGHDLLVGGAGKDRLAGSNGIDLLIGNTVDVLDVSTLVSDWQSARRRPARVALARQLSDLMIGDRARDVVLGENGQDLFVSESRDRLIDLNNEIVFERS